MASKDPNVLEVSIYDGPSFQSIVNAFSVKLDDQPEKIPIAVLLLRFKIQDILIEGEKYPIKFIWTNIFGINYLNNSRSSIRITGVITHNGKSATKANKRSINLPKRFIAIYYLKQRKGKVRLGERLFTSITNSPWEH